MILSPSEVSKEIVGRRMISWTGARSPFPWLGIRALHMGPIQSDTGQWLSPNGGLFIG